MSTGGRVVALDGLRGVAVLSVVAGHVSGSAFPVAGTTGVTIFFVLSGYLITGLLLKEQQQRGRTDYKAFYTRRALRLFPALVLMLLVYGIVLWIFDNEGVSSYPGEAALALAYVGN